jgi:hypothetical protein
VTAPYVEIDPEAILVPQHLDGSVLGDNAPKEDVSRWHIIDPEQESTWCGMSLSRSSERRSLSETPEDRRCQTCIERFGENVVRGQTD